MEKKKVNAFVSDIDIVGLSEKDRHELGYWYAYFTNRRKEGQHHPGWGYMLGEPIVDDKAIRKGIMLLGNVLSKLDKFTEVLPVESINSKNSVTFKCENRAGEKVVVDFKSGDLIDFPTEVSVIGCKDVKRASIMLDKGIVFDKLSYYDAKLEELNDYYRKIYESAYSVKNNNNKR